MGSRSSSLWRNRDFLKLWAGQSVSVTGSQVTLLALPLTAVLVLGASPLQMGVLGAAQLLPELAIGLVAGAWVDRLRRRPIMIACDLVRAAALALIPLAYALDLLSMPLMIGVAFTAGTCSVFYGAAYVSLLPSLVERSQLVEGNAKLQMSQSFAWTVGASLGGVLVQIITAPISIALDAASFVISAVSVRLIRRPEPRPSAPSEQRSIWTEIGEGVRLVAGDRVLRAIAGSGGLFNLFGRMAGVLYVLYVTRELGVSAAGLGVIFAGLGPGAFLGSVLASRAARRLGIGPSLVAGLIAAAVGMVMIPLAGGPPALAIALLTLGQILTGIANGLYGVNLVSLRQAITPDRLQGRTSATTRLLFAGAQPLGQLAGGILGDAIGLRLTLLLSAGGAMLAVLWLLLSPVRTLREPPVPEGDPTRL